MYCIFSCSEAPHLQQTITVPGWAYKLPRGQKFSMKLSPLSVRFSQRRPSNLIKQTGAYKLPRGAIYKPPCVQLINNPVLLYIKFLRCQLCVVDFATTVDIRVSFNSELWFA